MSKKLAIITLYGEHNFGNKLQNYATQLFFSNMGFECKTIRYHKRKSLLKKILNIRELISGLGLFSKVSGRENKIRSFSQRYLNIGESVKFNHLPADLQDKYDYFVTGSDQVWHNYSKTKEEINYFMLAFAKPEQRLTMSPSFGIKYENIPKNLLPYYKDGLLGFDKLSCREEEAADIIYRLTGKKAMVELDPTMLIDIKYWHDMAKKPVNFAAEDYILLFFWGGATSICKDYCESLAGHFKLRIIDLCDENHSLYDMVGAEEFLWLVKNAGIVATDSFHAVVFSILFKRPFFVYSRQNASSMENRIDTLLRKFGLSDRKNVLNNYKRNLFDCDYSRIDDILKSEIRKTQEFYNEILND